MEGRFEERSLEARKPKTQFRYKLTKVPESCGNENNGYLLPCLPSIA